MSGDFIPHFALWVGEHELEIQLGSSAMTVRHDGKTVAHVAKGFVWVKARWQAEFDVPEGAGKAHYLVEVRRQQFAGIGGMGLRVLRDNVQLFSSMPALFAKA